ncbi:hypothetical protein SETIT_1G287000v2 [Setaria italica]|uniref:Secreted protein n=1 Tax=Setaria italica TaxID=4555 RepID=A0A368PSK6_SETIT|nr:hypothetical protein SETIT_1G287000v2 [Setaria italica]
MTRPGLMHHWGTRVSLFWLPACFCLCCALRQGTSVSAQHTSTHALMDRLSPLGVIMASTQLLCWCFVPCFRQKMFRVRSVLSCSLSSHLLLSNLKPQVPCLCLAKLRS